MCPDPESQARTEVAERVQRVLACKHLNLSQASQISAARYGRSSPYFLPHNLYYDLRLGAFSPSIYQIFALSGISGYRLTDWLRVFHFDLGNIPRLQVLLPARRTILLDSCFQDPNTWVPWFRNRAGDARVPSTAPLMQLLEVSSPRRLGAMSRIFEQGGLYAKIGDRDALAFPDLLPGSIVRVNPAFNEDLRALAPGETSPQIYLVEHGGNFCCCRLRGIDDRRVITVSTQLPYSPIEFTLPGDAILHGSVDLEIRPLAAAESPKISHTLVAEPWASIRLSPEQRLSRLLRNARRRMAMSLREASALSRRIADWLGEEQYFVSASALCDYEARDLAPRHVHKIITLCLLYAVNLFTFLRASGITLEEAGTEPIPDDLLPSSSSGGHRDHGDPDPTVAGGFLGELLRQFGEVPFFLRRSLAPLSGLPYVSLNDIFWIGGESHALHPYLSNGLLVMVNRRKKRPIYFAARPPWEQSLYVILRRDGTYLCGCCELEHGALILHPGSQSFGHLPRLRLRQDAEIIGQIVAVARRLR